MKRPRLGGFHEIIALRFPPTFAKSLHCSSRFSPFALSSPFFFKNEHCKNEDSNWYLWISIRIVDIPFFSIDRMKDRDIVFVSFIHSFGRIFDKIIKFQLFMRINIWNCSKFNSKEPKRIFSNNSWWSSGLFLQQFLAFIRRENQKEFRYRNWDFFGLIRKKEINYFNRKMDQIE